jgi:chromatin segregation and condensation protein Rec8/ScpA/Scc1 (kleisin family)
MVRVEEDQKQRWKEHAQDEDKYRSLTNLVEQAVEKRIAEDNEQYTLEDQMGEVLGLLEQQQREQQKLIQLAETIEDTQATTIDVSEEVQSLRAAFESRLDIIADEVTDD